MVGRPRGKSRVEDIDFGYTRLAKAFEVMSNHDYVDIGFLAGSNADKLHPRSRKTLAQVSFNNEFGVEENVPARPHHRVAFDEAEEDYLQGLIDFVNDCIDEGMDKGRRTLVELAEQAAENLADTIADTSSPANAEFTIQRKGFDDPLVETGQMQASPEHRTSWERND